MNYTVSKNQVQICEIDGAWPIPPLKHFYAWPSSSLQILEASEKYYSYEVLCVVRMYSSSESLTYPGMTSLYALGNCRSNGTNLKCLIVSELAALWKSTYSTRYLIQCCKVCAWFVTCWVSPILCPIMSFTCFVSYYEFHLCCVLLWV